jgi:hypothetical protein
MWKAIPTVALFSVAFAACAAAQLPPGYEIIQVTEDAYYQPGARMNNRGQFVFMTWFDVSDRLTEEIFLYDNGELIRLTDDYVQDVCPDINDDGTIVWCRGIGPINPDTGEPSLEIVVYEGGELTTLTDNGDQDVGPSINNVGQIVWDRWPGGGCEDSRADIYFHDGQSIHQITDDDWSNQGAEINDFGDIVWTQYDFCVDPWESRIMMYSDHVITQISPDETFEPRGVSINNAGQVAWTFQIAWGEHGIQLWEDGVTILFTDWGSGVRLNDQGDMYFHRWYEDESTYQAWLYVRGRFYQLSDDSFWNTNGDINNVGEAVWGSGNYPWKDLRLLKRVRPSGNDAGRPADVLNVQPVLP